MTPSAVPVALTLIALCAGGWWWRTAGRKLRLPPAISLMLLGALTGPAALDLTPAAYTAVAPVLSKAAFVMLLVRAGLSLDPAMLRAILLTGAILGTIPVAVEVAVVAGLSRWTLFAGWDLALLAGFLIAAVSPAVVLPTMLSVKERGLGAAMNVPGRAMAQTIINAFVAQTGIVILLQWISPEAGQPSPFLSLGLLPLSVPGGLAVGVLLGTLIPAGAIRPGRVASIVSAAAVVALGMVAYFACPLLRLENVFATVAVGAVLRRRLQPGGGVDRSEPIRRRLSSAWRLAEIVLFVNLGAAVDVGQLGGGLLLIGSGVIAVALGARVITVALLLRRSRLDAGEQTYLALAHLPKATIQAVFGAVPLATFLRHGQPHLEGDGQTLLVLSVLAIVTTAPVGAVLLERTAVRLLRRTDP